MTTLSEIYQPKEGEKDSRNIRYLFSKNFNNNVRQMDDQGNPLFPVSEIDDEIEINNITRCQYDKDEIVKPKDIDLNPLTIQQQKTFNDLYDYVHMLQETELPNIKLESEDQDNFYEMEDASHNDKIQPIYIFKTYFFNSDDKGKIFYVERKPKPENNEEYNYFIRKDDVLVKIDSWSNDEKPAFLNNYTFKDDYEKFRIPFINKSDPQKPTILITKEGEDSKVNIFLEHFDKEKFNSYARENPNTDYAREKTNTDSKKYWEPIEELIQFDNIVFKHPNNFENFFSSPFRILDPDGSKGKYMIIGNKRVKIRRGPDDGKGNLFKKDMKITVNYADPDTYDYNTETQMGFIFSFDHPTTGKLINRKILINASPNEFATI